ncbi:MAG: heme exporter protein CcmB [Pseudomonadota bacterium]
MTSDSLLRAFTLLLKRDLTLAIRHRAEMINPLLFFVLVTSLFPLGIGADPKLLQAVGPGVIWVAALLAALLSLEGIFRSDFEDGTLEQFLLSSHPVSVLVLAKVLAHWLITGLPLLVISPLLGVLLGLPGDAIMILLVTLALGTPVLSLIGAVGVALTVGLRKGGMILSLLVLPLYIPLLIFAANAVDTAAAGLPVTAHLSLISALLVLSLSLSPLATAAALRISLS